MDVGLSLQIQKLSWRKEDKNIKESIKANQNQIFKANLIVTLRCMQGIF
jgi:hypothetical protein